MSLVQDKMVIVNRPDGKEKLFDSELNDAHIFKIKGGSFVDYKVG